MWFCRHTAGEARSNWSIFNELVGAAHNNVYYLTFMMGIYTLRLLSDIPSAGDNVLH